MSGRWPPGVPSVPARRGRHLLGAGLVALAVAVVALVPATMATAQDEPAPTASEPGVSESSVPPTDSVVPAAPPSAESPTGASPAAEEPTTTLAVVTPPGSSGGDVPLTESEKATRAIEYVIAGLIALAVLILVVSIVFWRRTKPSRILAAEVARTASAQPSVLTSQVPESVATPVMAGPDQAATSGPAPAADPPAGPVVPAPSGFSTSPNLPTAAPPAEDGSWGATAAALGLSTMPESTEGPENAVNGAPESHPHEMWASQGWGADSPSPTRPDPTAPAAASTAPAPIPPGGTGPASTPTTDGAESELPPEGAEESTPDLPPGYFGRTDDIDDEVPAEGDRSETDSTADNGAPNPFLPRR